MENTSSHPIALPFLFLTEMWERFGFYIAQGLLVLYMTEYFGFTDSESYTILGVFTALVYISPIVGGYLADHYLGFPKTIITGGIFLILGYALLTLPLARIMFYPALATIVVGNGMFKPNISSLLGLQYAANDPKRDSGFTIFYIGINIGALLAGLSSGYIKEYIGWRTSFGLAAIGLVLGVTIFSFGLRYLKKIPKPQTSLGLAKLISYCLGAIIVITLLLRISLLADWLLPVAGIILLGWLAMQTRKQQGNDRKRFFLLSVLIVSSVIFWMLFFQIFFSATLFIERLVDKNLFGLKLSTTVFYASESVFILVCGPFFAMLWNYLGRNNKNPSPISKFILGIFIAGLGFITLGTSTLFPNAANLIPAYWVFAAYFLITVGELFLSPIGLSAVTFLAPSHLVGMMMGIWFVATGFGGMFAGYIAHFASVPESLQLLSAKLAIYQHAFYIYACIAFVVSLLLFIFHWRYKQLLA